VGGQHHAPAILPPAKRPSTPCTQDWVGLGVGLDGSRKSHPPPEFKPQTVQPWQVIKQTTLSQLLIKTVSDLKTASKISGQQSNLM